MQQIHFRQLPEFTLIDSNLDWLGDSLQVFEFMNTFGDKLKKEALETLEQDFNFEFSNILLNIESFRCALENKLEKYRKELNQLTQFLTKLLVSNLEITQEEEKQEEEEEEDYFLKNLNRLDLNENTLSEILRLYLKKCLNYLENRKNNSFQIDITFNLKEKLKYFIENLNLNNFDYLNSNIKAAILAFLCDELLLNLNENSNSNYQSNENDSNKIKSSLIVEHIDETIEKLNKYKQEKKANEYEQCAKMLRSARNIGQDRFKRHYWLFNDSNDLLVEAHFENNILNLKSEQEQVKHLMDEILTKIEIEQEEEQVLNRFSHLIEQIKEPEKEFSLKLNTNNPADVLNLSFKHIQILVKHKLQYKNPIAIDKQYLSDQIDSSSKWWICESQKLTQFKNSLSKRGFREKNLLKNLSKIKLLDEEKDSRNEKLNSLFKDFQMNKQKISLNQMIHKEKVKLMKQVYSLEDKVFGANLQMAGNNMEQEKDQLEKEEDALQIAKNRLLKLEKRIDRRYLKYPFCSKKKLTNIKLKNNSEIDCLLAEKISNLTNKQANRLSIQINQCLKEYTNEINNLDKNSNDNNLVTVELKKWRKYLENSKTCSQVYLCLVELNKQIEWDKSIMKVICHICNMDNNEEKLLLCDNCDRGYHTYCFKPKIEKYIFYSKYLKIFFILFGLQLQYLL